MMNSTNDLTAYMKLKFHIQHPDLEECYKEGYQYAIDERPEEDNPYSLGSEEREQWSDGWWAGFYKENPLFRDEPILEEVEPAPMASNDGFFESLKKRIGFSHGLMTTLLKITGVAAATALVGYQLFDMVV